MRIYWSLLDANAVARDGDPITRAILSDADEGARFAERVVAPIAKALDPRTLVGLEIVNEPEIVTPDCIDARAADAGPSIEWETLGALVARARDAALAEKPDLIVTAGTGHVFLPKLWRSGAGLSAIDVHVYHELGGLPSRADLARYVGDASIAREGAGAVPLIAGECGIPKESASYDANAIANYLHNGDRCAYDAVFLWKLEGDLVDTSVTPRRPSEAGRLVRDVLERRPASGFARG